jgi:hypothetical protein
MKTLVLWILILAIFIFGLAILSAPSREGIENASGDALMERFKYFKMLPEDNKWSQETVDAFKVKYKEMNMNTPLNDENLKNLQKFGSEEEAKIYIETGNWPMNEYTKTNIKNFIYNDSNIKEQDKEAKLNETLKNLLFNMPNSSLLFTQSSIVNGMDKPENMKGQSKFINLTVNENIKVDDTTNFKCTSDKPYLNENEVKDYKEIEKVPGFKFLQSPCNPCSNRCPYSYEDVVLPAYAAYWGISSISGKATPAAVMDDVQYKKCFEKANGKIVDMGGEPVECP